MMMIIIDRYFAMVVKTITIIVIKGSIHTQQILCMKSLIVHSKKVTTD
jgi:hypothetical protein